ncbi:hypothetical protein PRNP1_007214 [Phytophthora ramorum]
MNVDLPLRGGTRGRRRARPTGARLPVKSSALLAALLFTLDDLKGQTSLVSAAASQLRALEGTMDIDDNIQRELAAGGDEEGNPYCHSSGSFLGVGNTLCLHENLQTAVFLLAVIIAISIAVDRLIECVRASIKCPQLRKIVNRVFEEVMILGFLSMVIFTLNTSGALKSLRLNDLTASEQLHFYEFFHYIVFLTMIYFIVIVLLLLFIGTVVPKLVWEIKKHPDERRESISDIHDDTYDPRHPSIVGSSSDRDDCGANGRRMRHSFIRDASSLARDLNPYSSGSSFIEDGERTLDTPSDDYYIAMRARQRSDGDGVYRTMAMRTRALSGMDLVLGTRAYSLLIQRYQREGWCFHFNVRKQWNLWKSFEILAYNICQNRSGYIYKNPAEMERLFGVRSNLPAQGGGEDGAEDDKDRMTYAKYHVLFMRNLLLHMTNIHPSAFIILVVICLLPSMFPGQDHWIFIGVGGLLLLVNVVIFFKVLKILRGIVDDRLRIITTRDIQARLNKVIKTPGGRNRVRKRWHHNNNNASASESIPPSAEESTEENSAEDLQSLLQTHRKKSAMKFKAAALAVRAMIRMQMSALCHRQLHYHDDRFWFNSPKLLLRLFQFATIGQAFYLVWLSLVEINSVSNSSFSPACRSALLVLMVIFPVLSLFVITPLTMPSLVLVMSLTGIFVDLNASNGEEEGKHRNVTQEEVKTHTRIMRRSFLRSHYTEGEGYQPHPATPPFGPVTPPLGLVTPPLGSVIPSDSSDQIAGQRDSVASPTNVFLRIYDSPASSVTARPSGSRYFPGNSNSIGRNNSLGRNNMLSRWRGHSRSVGSMGSASGDDGSYGASRRAFNLAAFQSMGGSMSTAAATNADNQAPQGPPSFTSSTSSLCRSPRPTRMEISVPAPTMNWSQANVEPDMQVGNNTTDDNNEQENDLEQIPSPVSASFKSYCSKYGGYPDL